MARACQQKPRTKSDTGDLAEEQAERVYQASSRTDGHQGLLPTPARYSQLLRLNQCSRERQEALAGHPNPPGLNGRGEVSSVEYFH